MNVLRIMRIVGFAFIVLGPGSAFTRSQLEIDTILTAWMGGAQPWSGIGMGVVGVILVVVAIVLGRRREAADEEARLAESSAGE